MGAGRASVRIEAMPGVSKTVQIAQSAGGPAHLDPVDVFGRQCAAGSISSAPRLRSTGATPGTR